MEKQEWKAICDVQCCFTLDVVVIRDLMPDGYTSLTGRQREAGPLPKVFSTNGEDQAEKQQNVTEVERK